MSMLEPRRAAGFPYKVCLVTSMNECIKWIGTFGEFCIPDGDPPRTLFSSLEQRWLDYWRFWDHGMYPNAGLFSAMC